MPQLTIVFDLDGTLVDTAPDLVDTLNVILSREQMPPVPYADGRTMIGGGARKMIELGLAAARRTATAGEVDRMFNDFISHYADHIADRSRPFPGLEETLDALAARDCRFAVCTNKLESLSRMLLDALGLTKRFAAICGQDTFGIHKPNPEMLRRTIRQAGGSVDHAVMVGDSANDIDTARAACVPVIAVDFGYTETPVERLGANRVIGHFRDLPAAVFALVAADQRPDLKAKPGALTGDLP